MRAAASRRISPTTREGGEVVVVRGFYEWTCRQAVPKQIGLSNMKAATVCSSPRSRSATRPSKQRRRKRRIAVKSVPSGITMISWTATHARPARRLGHRVRHDRADLDPDLCRRWSRSGNALTVHRRTASVASTAADLTAQVKEVTDGDLKDIVGASSQHAHALSHDAAQDRAVERRRRQQQ